MTKNDKLVYSVMLCFFGIPALFGFFLYSTGERDTKLIVKGANPPKFVMTGSGKLGFIRIRGPKQQRDVDGEARWLYWTITVDKDNGFESQSIERVSPIIYGEVPKGYKQVYPEKGVA